MLATKVPASGGASIQPDWRPDLEAAVGVLGQQGQQAVVGVLPHAPAAIAGRRCRVTEHPEQDGRAGRVPGGEVVRVKAQAQRHAAQHRLAEAGQRVDIGQNRGTQAGNLLREEVAAVQRKPGPHPWIVGAELGAEIEPLLQVGLT